MRESKNESNHADFGPKYEAKLAWRERELSAIVRIGCNLSKSVVQVSLPLASRRRHHETGGLPRQGGIQWDTYCGSR